jgi:hypothetical protein
MACISALYCALSAVAVGTEYYYTFSSSNASALAELTPQRLLTLLQTALQNALQEVLPVSWDVAVMTWVQLLYDSEAQGTLGFSFSDADGNALTTDLSGLFVGNASTTATVARKLLELFMCVCVLKVRSTT